MAGLYAQKLAENGYLVADASYQGASGGEPRHTDKPAYREEDIHGMVFHNIPPLMPVGSEFWEFAAAAAIRLKRLSPINV